MEFVDDQRERSNQYLKYLKLVAISVKGSNRAETVFGGISRGTQKSSINEENMEGVVSVSLGPLPGKRLNLLCSVLVL